MREGLRPGGRSARVQRSIHEAVKALLQEKSRSCLTVPMIAARAGVTPTTIYRRWTDLPALLADVSIEAWQMEVPPKDHGSLRADLQRWLEEFLDEMSSAPGQQMLKDVYASADSKPNERCCDFTAHQLTLILERAAKRGEGPLPAVDDLLDGAIAPILYRIMFHQTGMETARLHALIDRVLAHAGFV